MSIGEWAGFGLLIGSNLFWAASYVRAARVVKRNVRLCHDAIHEMIEAQNVANQWKRAYLKMAGPYNE